MARASVIRESVFIIYHDNVGGPFVLVELIGHDICGFLSREDADEYAPGLVAVAENNVGRAVSRDELIAVARGMRPVGEVSNLDRVDGCGTGGGSTDDSECHGGYSGHGKGLCRGVGEVDDPAGNKRTAVVDLHIYRLVVGEILDKHDAPERQREMRGGKLGHVEYLTACGLSAIKRLAVPTRDSGLRVGGGRRWLFGFASRQCDGDTCRGDADCPRKPTINWAHR